MFGQGSRLASSGQADSLLHSSRSSATAMRSWWTCPFGGWSSAQRAASLLSPHLWLDDTEHRW